ncbi:MAG: alpha/beta-type small acid-soluble spore protein [Halanaerobium sp.]|nr:alpha/beta-type small acid-soluble spore protein [Halanaerobium sp.]
MAKGQRSNTYVNPLAAEGMERFKYEIAQELGIQTPPGGYWGTMTTRDTGAIGGNMVRKMVEAYENNLAGGASYQTTGTARTTGGESLGGRNTDTLPTGRTQYGGTGGTRY